jgi:flagellar protein FliS
LKPAPYYAFLNLLLLKERDMAVEQASRYRRSQIDTASPGKLVIMLYEGAIRFLNEARECLSQKDLEKANNRLIRAQDIISELMMSLNMKEGGQIASSLYRLYDYLKWRLVEANISKNPDLIDEAIRIMSSLKEAWEEAVKNVMQDKTKPLEPSKANKVNLMR